MARLGNAKRYVNVIYDYPREEVNMKFMVTQ
jgi:hypothetical protein